jgi:hypothetical protein
MKGIHPHHGGDEIMKRGRGLRKLHWNCMLKLLTLSSAFEFVVSYFFDVGLLTYKLQVDASYLPRLAIWTFLIGVSMFMIC